jgi:peptidoglycan/LPS O-acetylase OafA/YrhL
VASEETAAQAGRSGVIPYRAAIDGLRALAVVPVVLFHAGFSWFSGGYVGVDVFFVISGYLITTIILREQSAGVFSLAHFYERRVRRILPALFVVLIACLIPAWLWLVPAQLRNFSTATAAVSVFASNFVFWTLGGYFGTRAEENPLIHTWSLAVEEQYYMLFPLLVIALWPFGIRVLGCAVFAIALLSISLSQYGLQIDPIGTFFLTPTRGWELLIGSLLAFFSYRTPLSTRVGRTANQILATLGLALIVGSALTFDKTTPFPGVHALIPTTGAALIIGFGATDTFVARMLSLRLVVLVGLISYSLYLWHQPLFAFARIATDAHLRTETYIALIFVAVILAYVTWRHIEVPFRQKGFFTRRQVFCGAATLSMLLVGLGVAGYLAKGFFGRYGPEAQQLFATAESSPKRRACHTSGQDFLAPHNACTYFNQNVRWAVLGDSHAVELSYVLAEELRSRSGVLHLTFSACPPALAFDAHTPGCTNWIGESLQYLEQKTDIQNVILVFRHSYYLFGDQIDFFPNVPNERPRFLRAEPAAAVREKYWESFVAIINRLLISGKHVYIMFPVPELSRPVARNVYRTNALGPHSVKDEGLALGYYMARNSFVLPKLEDLPWGERLIPIRPAEALCDISQCYAVRNGTALYFDDNHLSLTGARAVLLKDPKILGNAP